MDVAKFPPRLKGKSFTYSPLPLGPLEQGLGLSLTKTGPDDKYLGYIIRQNTFLRLILISIIIFFSLFFFLSQTLYQVQIQRRDAIDSEVLHRDSEHSAQTKLLDTQINLKMSLETIMHQYHRLAEFRSFLEAAFGTNGERLNEALSVQSHLSKEFVDGLIRNYDLTGQEIVTEINRIFEQFEGEYKSAQKVLETFSDEIIADIEEDGTELEEYKNKLREFGVKQANPDHLKRYRDKLHKKYRKGIKHQKEEEESQLSVENKLEKFFEQIANLNLLDSSNDVKFIPEEVIDKWEEFLKEVISTLSDGAKETDLKNIIERANEMFVSAGLQPFDRNKDSSIVDFIKRRIYEARLLPHRKDLMELGANWKAKRVRTMETWKQVESVSRQHLDFFLTPE